MLSKIRRIFLILVLLAVTFMEIKAFKLTISSLGTGIFIYYTEISNLITLLSSIVAIVYLLITFNKPLKFPKWLSASRFLSATMLLMTMLITIFVLVPHSPHLKDSLLFSGYGLYHHTLAPILTIASYIFIEPHYNKKRVIFVPLMATFIYGFIMVFGNIFGKVSGPYFFLRVNYQPLLTSVIWCVGLLLLVSAFAGLIYVLGFVFDFLKKRLIKNN